MDSTCTEDKIDALEIVSPLFYDERSRIEEPRLDGPTMFWREAVRKLYESLSNDAYLCVNESCGLHVHISPDGESVWTLQDLKRISQAIIYFDSAIECLVPPHRRQNVWSKSNRVDNPKLNGKSDSRILKMIDSYETLDDIVMLMINGSDRNYGWNFTNIYTGGTFTVEFRRGPGAAQREICLQWTEFVINFVHAAKCGGTESELAVYSRDVQGLRHFLRGYPVSKGDPSLINPLFENKTGSLQPRRIEDRIIAEAGTGSRTKMKKRKGKT